MTKHDMITLLTSDKESLFIHNTMFYLLNGVHREGATDWYIIHATKYDTNAKVELCMHITS